MSNAVRVALIVGIVLGIAYILVVLLRRRELKGGEICEAIGLALSPFPIPGAAEMIYKAFDRDTLPIFNSPENRAALIIGGILLIATFLYSLYVAVSKALQS
jgi:hypothetical protein